MKKRLSAAAGLLLALVLLASCAAVQSATRSAFNTDMTEATAPPLVGTEWIDPPFAVDAPRDDALGRDWVLVKFLDPG